MVQRYQHPFQSFHFYDPKMRTLKWSQRPVKIQGVFFPANTPHTDRFNLMQMKCKVCKSYQLLDLTFISESSDISPCPCVGFEAKEKMVVNAPVFELLASSHADVVPPDKTTFHNLEI